MAEMQFVTEFLRLFRQLPDEKKELVIEKARQLVKETEERRAAKQQAKEDDHG